MNTSSVPPGGQQQPAVQHIHQQRFSVKHHRPNIITGLITPQEIIQPNRYGARNALPLGASVANSYQQQQQTYQLVKQSRSDSPTQAKMHFNSRSIDMSQKPTSNQRGTRILQWSHAIVAKHMKNQEEGEKEEQQGNDKRFQTLQYNSESIINQQQQRRRSTKVTSLTESVNRESDDPIERPNSLVLKREDRQSLPKTRVSLDSSIFAGSQTASEQINKYQTLQQQQNQSFNMASHETRTTRTNPLLKASKICHSAKDIIKNAHNHHVHNASKAASSSGNQSTTASSIDQVDGNKSSLQQQNLPFIEPSRVSQRSCGQVYAYATNTHDGLVRAYNEDYVAVVPDLRKPLNLGGNYQSKKVSYFGLFDGHGGSGCAQYLRDNLHQIIAAQECFPASPETALRAAFKHAEDDFMRQNQTTIREKSGSCAIVVMIVDDTVYCANVGDSRAILSSNNGQLTQQLTMDHKPCEEKERKRILEAGGQLYQNYQIITPTELLNPDLGPIRVLPGRLSVSRTFGDAHAKIEHFGGNNKVVIAQPEITHFKLNDTQHDFILIGCDGIFDKLSTEDTIGEVWRHVQEPASQFGGTSSSVNEVCGRSAERVIRTSMIRESLDNLSVILIAFKNFSKYLDKLSGSKPLIQQSNDKSQIQNSMSPYGALISLQSPSSIISKMPTNHHITEHQGSYISSRGRLVMQPPPVIPIDKERKSAQPTTVIVKKSEFKKSTLSSQQLLEFMQQKDKLQLSRKKRHKLKIDQCFGYV